MVSVHAGVVHFFEGSVSIDGQPLEQKFGRFFDIKAGSELRTDQGRAEVLLTPGVILRVDQNSSIRMVDNRLTAARVEFIGGSAAADTMNAPPNPPVTIMYRGYEVHMKQAGRYRFDSAPAELRVERGEAEVAYKGRTAVVASDQVLRLDTALAAHPDDTPRNDTFDRWSEERSASVASDNAAAAASDDLTNSLENPQGNAYDFSAYPVTTGGMLVPGGYLSPYSLYPGALYPYGYGIFPLYRQGIGSLGYRPIPPIRIGTYVPGGMFQTRPRVTVPTFRAPASTGVSHPASAGHAGGHR